MNNIFQQVEKPAPPRSRFDLSHAVKGTFDMGYLYPIQNDIGIPGDVWDMGVNATARLMPMVAPILDGMRVYFHVFKTPIRILDENFEEFVTGGEDGTNSYTVPTWTPSTTAVGSVWDCMGFPVGVTPTGKLPIDYPLRAMNLIYNEYYRDQNLVAERTLTDDTMPRRAWERDYFTAASPTQQKGTAPAFPISGTTSAAWSTTTGGGSALPYVTGTQFSNQSTGAMFNTALNNNTVDLSSATTFSLNDFRLVAVVQQYMELMQRTGARYPEYLKAIFNQYPKDLRLQRPEYCGGWLGDIMVSEVLQTGETGTTPQGNLAGHGIMRTSGNVGKIRCEEWCIITTLMSIMPECVYNSQGVDRQWTPETKEDWYNPLFAHLAEQPIYRAELYATGTQSENETIFGYQGRWDEHRQKKNRVVGKMRTDFDEWTLARQFSSAPELNQSFIECNPENRFSAAPSEPAFIMNVGLNILATRPLPALASPGLRRI